MCIQQMDYSENLLLQDGGRGNARASFFRLIQIDWQERKKKEKKGLVMRTVSYLYSNKRFQWRDTSSCILEKVSRLIRLIPTWEGISVYEKITIKKINLRKNTLLSIIIFNLWFSNATSCISRNIDTIAP